MNLTRKEIDRRRQQVFAKYNVTDFIILTEYESNYGYIETENLQTIPGASLIGCYGVSCPNCQLSNLCGEMHSNFKPDLIKALSAKRIKLKELI